MIVHLTGEAEHELERIGDYIAQDSPKRALTSLYANYARSAWALRIAKA